MRVNLGSARVFPDVVQDGRPAKERVIKPIEEASEIHAAWERLNSAMDEGRYLDVTIAREDMLDEIADVLQSLGNLAYALGVTNLAPYMARCEDKNRKRGRYGSGGRNG